MNANKVSQIIKPFALSTQICFDLNLNLGYRCA